MDKYADARKMYAEWCTSGMAGMPEFDTLSEETKKSWLHTYNSIAARLRGHIAPDANSATAEGEYRLRKIAEPNRTKWHVLKVDDSREDGASFVAECYTEANARMILRALESLGGQK